MPSENTEQRKLAAIMFTDMVGYSALSQRNEALALELLAEQQRLLRTQFPLFNGREVKTTGDGFLVEFPSALQATQCAVEIQRAVVARNSTQPIERHIHVRIGIHVGDVVHREADMYGDGVNIAARIEPLATGGGICLSDTVYAQVRNKLEVRLTKLDSPELKNIKLPIDVYRVVLPWQQQAPVAAKFGAPSPARPNARTLAAGLVAVLVLFAVGGGWWLMRQRGSSAASTNVAPVSVRSASPGRITSLAVKPLDDFSGDTNNAYLSDGMTEALCAALGNVSTLRVPGRSSVMRFKGGQKSIQEMAKELNVDAMVEGSIQRAGSRMMITVQLIDAATDRHLWATNYLRDLSEFFVVQNEVARAIANEVQLRLTPEDQARLARARAVNPAALDAYLKARQHWLRFTPQGFQAAMDYCHQAINSDPNYAEPYVQLGGCYIASANHELISPRVALAEAKKYVGKALELEETASGRNCLAAIQFFYDWDWKGVEQNVKRALELSEKGALIHDIYAKYLTTRGRFDEAIFHARRAVELEPYAPVVALTLGEALYFQRTFDQAVAQNRKMTNAFPDFVIARVNLGWSLLAHGQPDQAVTVFQEALRLRPIALVLGGLGHALARSGQNEAVGQILVKLREQRKEAERTQQFYVSPYHLAVVYAGLGQNAEALDWLEKGFDEKIWRMAYLKVDPALDSLRNEPRFQALLKNMGLER